MVLRDPDEHEIDAAMAEAASLTACCGAPVRQWHDDGGADEDACRECDAELCSHCAAVFEREDGYGDDGRGVRTFALCKSCGMTKAEIAEEKSIRRGEEEEQEGKWQS